MKVYIRNHQRLIKVNRQRLKRQLRKALQLLHLHNAELSILFVNDTKMKKLNEQYRGIKSTTDVLSFPQTETQNLKLKTQNWILGDIVINLHKARRQADAYKLGFYDELKRLLVHGLLHLIHYNHETSSHQKRKMKAKERELLAALRHL
jgi:probable rRNA maturation factor